MSRRSVPAKYKPVIIFYILMLLKQQGRFASLSHNIDIAAEPSLWTLSMLRMQVGPQCVSANNDEPPYFNKYETDIYFIDIVKCNF